jgi:hypothetical protein
MKNRKLLCSICGDEVTPSPTGWAEGHNAAPVGDGRCCDFCNDVHVIPERIRRLSRSPDSKAARLN